MLKGEELLLLLAVHKSMILAVACERFQIAFFEILSSLWLLSNGTFHFNFPRGDEKVEIYWILLLDLLLLFQINKDILYPFIFTHPLGHLLNPYDSLSVLSVQRANSNDKDHRFFLFLLKAAYKVSTFSSVLSMYWVMFKTHRWSVLIVIMMIMRVSANPLWIYTRRTVQSKWY